MLSPERAAYFKEFVRAYEAIRRAERRGSSDPAYYRNLPYRDLSGTREHDWRIRAAAFTRFQEAILLPMEERANRSLSVLDLGAGNGWLSYRVASRGHAVAAVDLVVNSADGLGAHTYYDRSFLPVQAEFDHLPFPPGSIDLAVFNASFHYSTRYETTLAACLRVLSTEGLIVVMDTPVYRHQASGDSMVREREAMFTRAHGFPSNSLPNENYLTPVRLRTLGEQYSLSWEEIHPAFGLRWAIRRKFAALRAGHEVARFPILVGNRS